MSVSRIVVLMSCYNGEAYVKEQIDTILNQNDVDLQLLIRDDGSIDKTRDVIRNIKDPRIEIIEGSNVGFIKSFYELAFYAFSHFQDINYFAFADQDDIWHADKLVTGIKMLQKLNDNIPNLYCSNSIFMGGKHDGQLFRQKDLCYKLGNMIYEPMFQGCSMVFNKAALNLYIAKPSILAYHDRWLFNICLFLGNVVIDFNPHFNYRIHENNAIGQIEYPKEKGMARVLRSLQYWFSTGNDLIISRIANDFLMSFSDQITPKKLSLLETYSGYKSSLYFKLKMVFNSSFYPSSGFNIKYIFQVFCNKL